MIDEIKTIPLILFSVSILFSTVGIFLSAFVVSRQSKKIKYLDDLVSKYAIENGEMLDNIRKTEYNYNIKIHK